RRRSTSPSRARSGSAASSSSRRSPTRRRGPSVAWGPGANKPPRYSFAVTKIPVIGLAVFLGVFVGAEAAADNRYVQDPTGGLVLPMSPLAGDLDATTSVVNPAGSPFLGGWHVAGALTGLTSDTVDDTGGGWGLYYAAPIQIPFLPRFGIGLAAEQT